VIAGDPAAAAADADAADRVAQVLSSEAIDGPLADAQRTGMAVDGPGGLIQQQMIGAVLERPGRRRWPTTSAASGARRRSARRTPR
jgi:hypothetical protein